MGDAIDANQLRDLDEYVSGLLESMPPNPSVEQIHTVTDVITEAIEELKAIPGRSRALGALRMKLASAKGELETKLKSVNQNSQQVASDNGGSPPSTNQNALVPLNHNNNDNNKELPSPFQPTNEQLTELQKKSALYLQLSQLEKDIRVSAIDDSYTETSVGEWNKALQALAVKVEALKPDSLREPFTTWLVNLSLLVGEVLARIKKQKSDTASVAGSVHSQSTSVSHQAQVNAQGTSSQSRSGRQKLKLPERGIRDFESRRDDWLGFKQELKTLVEDETYDQSTKFTQLVHAVRKCPWAKGEIAMFHRTQNVEEAVNAIVQYYEHPSMVRADIDKQIESLIKLGPKPSAEEWTQFYLGVQLIVEMLSYSRIDELSEETFVRNLRAKIPQSLDALVRYEHRTVDKFLELVKGKYRAEILLAPPSSSTAAKPTSTPSGKHNGQSSRKQNQGNFAGISSQRQPLERDFERVCIFCKADTHASSQCQVVTWPNARRQKLHKLKACFRCLRNKFPCGCGQKCTQCRGDHHVLLCSESQPNSKNRAPQRNYAGLQAEVPPGGQSMVQARSYAGYDSRPIDQSKFVEMIGTPVRQVLWCKIRSGSHEMVVRVFLDPGSEVTLVNPRVASLLNLERHMASRKMLIRGPGAQPLICDRKIMFQLVAMDGSLAYPMQAWLYERLASILVEPPPDSLADRLAEMDIPVEDAFAGNTIPDLVVGVEYLERKPFRPVEERRVTDAVMAYRLPFGWSVRGFYNEDLTSNSLAQSYVAAIAAEPSVCPCPALRSVFGIEDDDKHDPTPPVEIRYEEKERRYVTQLPWAGKHRPKNNFVNAKRQLVALRRRLADKGVLQAYHEAIMELFQSGYAEKAEIRYCEQGYYLPHHPVIRADASKTKIRPVFNASSAVKDSWSLNDCLSRGEPLNCDLLQALVNFRTAKVPLISDIVKAFLQIRVESNDRDYLRFLWYSNLTDEEPTVYRMTSVLFGATCSPHILGAALRKLFDEHRAKFPALKEAREIIYMDDLFLDADSPENVEEILNQTKGLLGIGSFSLHEWTTTGEIRNRWPELGFKVPEPGKQIKCLGVQWEPDQDQLIIEPSVEIPQNPTRREAASVLARLYDPLDLTLPFKVRVRDLARRIGLTAISWDARLPAELDREFQQLAQEYNELKVVVPRGTASPVQELVVFTDASPQAYGAVAYLLDDEKKLNLLCAKGRLAPVKPSTVPKLELNAALMGAQLASRLRKSPRLEDLPCRIYCDSKITLCRIANQRKKFEVYVQNRLDKIRKLDNEHISWRYVATAHNPADVLTHGIKWQELSACKLWWQGPNMSVVEADQVPDEEVTEADEGDEPIGLAGWTGEQTEIKSVASCASVDAVTIDEKELKKKAKWEPVLSLPYTEALQKVLEMIREKEKTMEMRNCGKSVQHNEMTYAMLKLWRAVQRDSFGADYSRLRVGRKPQDRRLLFSGAFVDDWGVIRSKRRLPIAFPYELRYPLVLDSHSLVRDFIREEHKRMKHPGVNFLFGHLIPALHIFKLKRLVRDFTRNCRACNQVRGRRFAAPAAPLPMDRATEAERAFTTTGLDYFGPINTATKQKIYGLLFTCSRTRAIHLEAVTSLAKGNCVMALQRFFARRGVPAEIRSDNATTFQSTNAMLNRLVRRIEECQDDEDIRPLRIRWLFNAPRAPWWGGFFERMVGAVKKKLTHCNWRFGMRLEAIWTVLAEIEAIINSRPLVGQDSDEPPLTPAHFLTGQALTSLPTVPSFPNPEPVLRQYFRHRQLASEFWRRWTTEYMCTLRQEKRQEMASRLPQVGELVLVEDLPKPRGKWPVARIVGLHPGQDGTPRLAIVQTEKGSRYNRAIQSLIPLEAAPVGPPPPGEDVAARR